jgi:hypothetical protein
VQRPAAGSQANLLADFQIVSRGIDFLLRLNETLNSAQAAGAGIKPTFLEHKVRTNLKTLEQLL